MRKFGYIRDSKDSRDFRYHRFLEYRKSLPLRKEVDMRESIVSVLDQDALGSCVANAGFGAIRLRHSLDGIVDPKLGNRLHGYWGARKLAGDESWDAGSQIRNFFKVLNNYGYMPEEETRNGYDISTFTQPPSSTELYRMFDQKNKSEGQVRYFRISETGEDRVHAIKRALNNGDPVVMGLAVSNAFLDYTGLGVIEAPSDEEEIVGGHAFYLAGYNEHGVWKVGSWGEGWGDSGFGLISWDYIKWEVYPDIWVVEKAPYFSEKV